MTDFDKFMKDLSKLDRYQIELGVLSEDTGRKETARTGLTNAEIMFINEEGSPINHIPPRPVLKMTLDYAQKELMPKTIKKCVDLIVVGNIAGFEAELQKLCLRIEKKARHIIYDNDGTLTPNSPRTIAAKGDNHPLFDTGQLARSITCRVIKL